MERITILTRRISLLSFLTKAARSSVKFVLFFLKTGIIDFDILFYYGHTAVTRSLVNGLRETKTAFNINPFSLDAIGDTVFVLSDVGALAQAIEWKRRGKIKKLLAGPNLVELPAGSQSIISDPAIDLVLVSSAMSVAIYEKINPALLGRVVSWYAGVDTDYWKPSDTPKEKEVLVYWKNTPKAFCTEAELLLKNAGCKIHRVVYGHYSRKKFKALLERSKFAVFLSITETQGIALAESWAMDVPTIVWDPEIEHYYLRGIQTTAAPYLAPENGMRWKELADLKSLLENGNLRPEDFSPRKWVMGNMTDKSSAELFLNIWKNC